MPYIIDGDNLIGSSPDISLDDPESRYKLVQEVQKYQETRKNNITIVFDGVPKNGLLREDIGSKFCVVYPRESGSADEEIKRILNGYNYFKDVTLVTSDRELKTFAKKKGAKIVSSIEFYFQLKRVSRYSGMEAETRKRIDAELTAIEVDQWLKIFEE